jgi:predicted Zn-ribbon and HTH transcriptional regulator
MAVAGSIDPETLSKLFPVLGSLENLGALTSNFGIYELKPFKDWSDPIWKDKVFGMRLCNAGQILEISSYCGQFPASAHVQVTKIELIIRAVYSISGASLVSQESLQKYNEAHKSQLSALEFLRLWAGNLEQLILDRLDGIYGGLQAKQERLLQGVEMCESCGTVFSERPVGARKLKYSLSEIVCNKCLTDPPEGYLKEFDFDEPTKVASLVSPTTAPSPVGYTCPQCQQKFSTVEELTEHRGHCQDATGV